MTDALGLCVFSDIEFFLEESNLGAGVEDEGVGDFVFELCFQAADGSGTFFGVVELWPGYDEAAFGPCDVPVTEGSIGTTS